jgi:hypothetical protein
MFDEDGVFCQARIEYPLMDEKISQTVSTSHRCLKKKLSVMNFFAYNTVNF